MVRAATKAWFAATLAVLVFAGAAASTAHATLVSVRVEGASSTLLQTEIETSVHLVDGSDGTGRHACRGPIGERSGPTVTGALDDALRATGKVWRGEWSDSSGDFLITSIAGEQASSSGPWTILLNGVPTPVGGCSMKVGDGDQVLFARDVVFQTMTLGLSGPAEVQPGESFRLSVTDERDDGAPVPDAVVASDGLSATTDADGEALFAVATPGRYSFKATHSDGIRSNSIDVCVGVSGCESTGAPARITGLGDGSVFMRGAAPGTIRGTSKLGKTLGLALRFRGYGGRCRSWDGHRDRLVRRSCRAKLNWFDVVPLGRTWSLAVGVLPPGRYRIYARVSGSRGKPWRAGINRVDFRVLNRRLSAHALRRRSLRYLDRQARVDTVRSSGLLSSWAGLALGLRGRRSSKQLAAGLMIGRPARAASGELARNLAALERIRPRFPLAPMRKELISRQDPDGSFGGEVSLTAMAVLALPGTSAAARAALWLSGQQQVSGGFSAAGTGPADVDTTGLVAWALAFVGYPEEIADAAAFVRSTQNHDGGFPAVGGAVSNAQSTGFGLVAIQVSGGSRLGPRTADGITPTHFLAALQQRNGSIAYTAGLRATPVWVTSQALLGLTSQSLLSRSLCVVCATVPPGPRRFVVAEHIHS